MESLVNEFYTLFNNSSTEPMVKFIGLKVIKISIFFFYLPYKNSFLKNAWN